jgi:predicted metallopeptidase
MKLQLAPDIQERLARISSGVGFNHLEVKRIICFRSFGAKSKAHARIWSFPKIWQIALKIKSHYAIEVISERFEKLDQESQDKILIHELLHIPKNFSGALLHHRNRSYRINSKTIDRVYSLFKKK